VRSLAVARDGTKVVSGSWDGTVRVWDAATGKEWRRFGGGGLSSVAFSPDGRLVAAGDMAKSLALWDLETRKLRWRLPDQENSVMGIRFAPDGRTVAAVSGGSIWLWDVATGKEVRRIVGPDKGIYCIDLSPDGKLLAGGCEDRTVHVWDVATGKETHCLKGHLDHTFSVAFSPDGKLLASGGGDGDRTVRLWDLATGREVGRIPTSPNWIRPVAFSPDGKLLAVGTGQATVHLHDVATRAELRTLRLPGADDTWVMAVAFSPDGKVLFTAGREKVIRRWDLATGEEVNPFAGHQNEVLKVVPSHDGKTVVSAGADGLVCVWDAGAPRPTRQMKTGRGLSAVSLSADGGVLATAGGGVVTLWDPATGRERRQVRGHTGGVDAVALSPDGTLLASGSWQDHTVRLWDAATGTPRHVIRLPTPKGHNYGAVPLLFSSDGRVLFSGSADRTNLSLYFWDPATGKERRRLNVQASRLALSPDGKVLAVTDGQKVITLLDTGTGEERGRIGTEASVLAFAPDGRVLASGGVRGRIQLWEVSTLTQRHSFLAHQPGGDDQGSFAAGVSDLAFSGDGRTLVSGGGDTTVLLWDVWGLAGARPREAVARTAGQVWEDLGAGDGAVGFRAMQALVAAPAEAIDLLKQRLRPAAKADAERIRRSIARLDSDKFEERQQATAELEEAGEAARPYLEKALADSGALEARRRLTALRDRLNNPLTGDRLAALRAVEVLESLASPAARQLLAALARGDEAAPLTREAAAALRRLGGR
jgi:WD40 repeat protein